MKIKKISLLFSCLFASELGLAETTEIDAPEVQVVTKKIGQEVPFSNTVKRKNSNTDDAAKLLNDEPGISFYTGGGVSSLPVINGLADDRINIKVDGVPITSACPNHMNPALSYIAPSGVAHIDLFAGITPVSMGGDSVAGSISVESPRPDFAASGKTKTNGEITGFYRSNGNVRGANVYLNFASENYSAAYIGSTVKSNNYEDGNGNKVRATEYEVRNNLLKFAAKSGEHTFGINLGWQDIPYQGYPNQAMDMTSNKSFSYNLSYAGDFNWGKLDAKAYRQYVRHKMDMLSDKEAVVGHMPMDTRAADTGYSVIATLPLSEVNTLKVGNEFHRYALDDWWPPIAGSNAMGPNTFWNVNDGQRDRFAIFGELNSKWSDAWATQLGARLERVSMNTGNVQGYYDASAPYGDAYQTDAAVFNAKNHKKTDYNLDVTASSRYEPDSNSQYDIGFARKTRSPNMHERYTWANEAMMAGLMNNWFGDLNSYVGNLDLKPEIANTIRASADWHDTERANWGFKVSPFYTFVHDYINAAPNTSSNIYNMSMYGRKSLTFANHDAHLYGLDFSAKKSLGNLGGSWQTRAVVSYVRGKDEDGSNLYNIMPLNGKFYLDHQEGGWANTLELVVVANKDKIDSVRDEQKTSGYSLLNFRTGYRINNTFRVDAGIDNIFDKTYAYPLGGLDYLKTVESAPPMSFMNRPILVNAMGRSANISVTVNF
jgi:iron complex outermembrane receptor protein